MKVFFKLIILLFSFLSALNINAQESERPLPPVLDLLTVDPQTGHSRLTWSPGGSPDVAGYIIYLFTNQEGYPVDTVYNPGARSYTYSGSNASFYSESYVVAAIDSAGNPSPLSNSLNTMYLEVSIDTCSNLIELDWNRYESPGAEVSEYRIYYSSGGSGYSYEGSVAGNDSTYRLNSFTSYSEYCFYIEANLSNDSLSTSNSFCIETDLPVPPGWINADYASYNDKGNTELSFTIDPATEYNNYRLERSNNSLSSFTSIEELQTSEREISYTDMEAPEGRNYYRLSAVNSCGEAIVVSNICSTLRMLVSGVDDKIILKWNSYYRWRGGVSSFSVYRNISGFFDKIAVLPGTDTTYTDELRNIMYDTNQGEICYYISAEEGINPYYPDAVSKSMTACIEQPARVTVPNAFTPDANNLNDLFRPYLSFTPAYYRLIIKNRSGIVLFRTSDHLEAWDGKSQGQKLPEDVYIWFLETETPGGQKISRSGTVTIIFN